MAGYSAIADAGEAIVELLRGRMGDFVDREEVALASPGGTGANDDARLTVYLYRVAENDHLMNTGPQPAGHDRIRRPPLALDLYYLLTAHPSGRNGDETAKTREQHAVLGRALQVLRENPVLRGSDLRGSLAAESGNELRISRVSMNDQSMDELVSIWNTFGETPFQPSVSYLVSPVIIETDGEEPIQRVVERQLGSDREASRAEEGE